MGRNKPIRRHGPVNLFCDYCGKGLTPNNIVWSGLDKLCSDKCKNALELGKKSGKTS